MNGFSYLQQRNRATSLVRKAPVKVYGNLKTNRFQRRFIELSIGDLANVIWAIEQIKMVAYVKQFNVLVHFNPRIWMCFTDASF